MKNNINKFVDVGNLFRKLEKSYITLIFYIIFNSFHINTFAQADFTLSSSSGCTEFLVGMEMKNFVSDSTVWDFGDGTQGRGNTIYKRYVDAGVYNITMRAYKNGVPQIVTKSVTVHKTPVADFSWDVNVGCPPLNVNFNDKSLSGSSNIIKRTWSFSNGEVLEGNSVNVQQTFNIPGAKDISLIIEDQNGCKNTISYSSAVVVNNRPNVDFDISNSNSCELPITTNLINKTVDLANNTYLWNFGDGSTSTQTSPQHIYTAENDYTISLTATDNNGCKTTVSKNNLIVDENFSVDINFTDSVGCESISTTYKPVISSLYKSLKWTFDPNLQVDTIAQTITSNVVGVYPVKLEATSQFGCVISKTRNVYVSANPVVDFVASTTKTCDLSTPIQFTNQTPGNNTYFWTFGNGSSSSNPNPNFLYRNQGVFTIRLTAKNEFGCENTMTKSQYVTVQTPRVELMIDRQEGCIPLSTGFRVDITNAFTISNIEWNFGNGNTYVGFNPPNQNYTSVGKYTVTAKVYFVEGCDPITLTKEINAGVPTNYTATVSSMNICPSETLTGTMTNIPNAVYEWTVDGVSYASRTFSHKFTSSGTFPVVAKMTVNGCLSTKNVGTVTVKPTAANFTFSRSCQTTKVVFTNNNNQGVQTTWNFGDGTVLVNNNKTVEHTYPNNVDYTVKMSIYNASTGCSDEVTKVVNIPNSIFKDFSWEPIVGCAPLDIQFSAPNIQGSYNWYYNDERQQGRNFSIVEDSVGIYDLTLVGVVNGCRDTFSMKNLIQVMKPQAGFKMNPIGGCSPITVTFDDTSKSINSNIVSYNWKVGNLLTKTNVTTFTESFNISAIIPVELIIQDNVGCSDTVMNELIIARPFAEFQVPSKSFCTGNAFKPVNLSTGVGLTYYWNFGDGSPIKNDQFPEHYYTQEGVYDIELRVVDANMCEHTYKMDNAVTIQDIDYDFTAYPTVKHCPELLTDFSIIPQEITYRNTIWDFGNGVVLDDTLRNPQYIYMEAGVFDVTLTLEDYRGCKEVIKKEKLIDIGGPSGEFNITTSGSCAPVDIRIVADIKNSVANFWDYGDGNGKYDTDAHSESSHTYTIPGAYTPSVTIDDGLGCIVTVYGEEILIGGIEAKIERDLDIVCTGENIELVDITEVPEHAPIKSRLWKFSNGFTSTDSIVTQSFVTTDSSYIYVELHLEDILGCKSIAYDTFRIFSTAPLEVVDRMTICKGDTVQLSASRVHDYQWDASNTLSQLDIPNPNAFPVQSTTYKVRGYVSPTCFTDKTVFVEVKDAFTGETTLDTNICTGENVQLTVQHENINSGQFTYQWSLNGELIDTLQTINVSPDESSTYIVTVQNGACKDFVAPVTIQVTDYPSLTVKAPETILLGEEVKLEAISEPGVSYSWEPSPNIGCSNCPFAFYKPTSTSSYTVSVNNDGCINSEEITLEVISECDQSLFEIQNVFSPNYDGVNDVFSLRNNSFMSLNSLKIYARTGELIYQSSNILEPWDGTFNGSLVNSGVYIYYIDAVCKNGDPLLLKGNITLLR